MSETDPKLEPTRVREFAHFFKRYMSISAVVAAALPIPVTSFGLIPVYSSQKPYLSTYTSLFCFLTLGFLFFSRHRLAQKMFPILFGGEYKYSSSDRESKFWSNLTPALDRLWSIFRSSFIPALPALLILLAFTFTLVYHYYLNESIGVVKSRFTSINTEELLSQAPVDQIPYATTLTLSYLAIFIMAEAAFILMAIKEYIQDLLGVTDIEIMTRYEMKDKKSLREALEDKQQKLAERQPSRRKSETSI